MLLLKNSYAKFVSLSLSENFIFIVTVLPFRSVIYGRLTVVIVSCPHLAYLYSLQKALVALILTGVEFITHP